MCDLITLKIITMFQQNLSKIFSKFTFVKTKITKCFCFFLCFLSIALSSQNRIQPCIFINPNDSTMQISEEIDTLGFLTFKKAPLAESWDLTGRITLDYLGLDPDISFQLASTKQRPNASNEVLKTVKYKQYYKGIPVECGLLIEHWQDCLIALLSGKVLCDLSLSVNPTLNPAQSIQAALDRFNSTTYYWQDSIREAGLKEETGNPAATYYPAPQLMINCNKVLVYAMAINSAVPHFSYTVQVNANTGAIEDIENNEVKCLSLADDKVVSDHVACSGHDHKKSTRTQSLPATHLVDDILSDSYTIGSTSYNGLQTLKTTNTSGCHRLIANYYYTKIETRDLDFGDISAFKWEILTKPTIPNDTSNPTWPESKKDITGPHWIATKSMDYFNQQHGFYPSVNNTIKIAANGGSFSSTALNFATNIIQVDILFGVGYFGAVDIVGHEFSHIVSVALGGLKGGSPIAESYSDILGEMIEYNTLGGNDWLIGADVITLRDMANPRSTGPANYGSTSCGSSDPDTYLGPGWITDPLSLCAPHVNCGVQNKWFTLLAEGGIHNGKNITALGMDKAISIAYHTLENFVFKTIDYPTIARAHIKSAEFLYGICSLEHRMTKLAWEACGINIPIVCFYAPSNHVICTDKRNLPIQISATSPVPLTWTPLNTAIIIGGTTIVTNPANWSYAVSSTVTGSTLNITNIPANTKPGPYYFRITDIYGNKKTVTIIIKDCKNIVGDPQVSGGPCDFFALERQSRPSYPDLDQVTFQPNPVSNKLVLLSLPQGDVQYEIYNYLGQIVNSGSNIQEHAIDVSTLPAGTYLLKINSNGHNRTLRFVKI